MYEALSKAIGSEVTIHVNSHIYTTSILKGRLSHVNEDMVVLEKNKKQYVIKLDSIIWFNV